MSIVGVTGESKDKTVPWIEQHGVRYAYGYLSKDAMAGFMQALGMRGYPSAALVDPKGEVVWTGHPASIRDGLIEKHLRGAETTPVDVAAVVRKWPDEASHARAAFAAGQLGKALEHAKKLPEEWSVAADVQRAIDKRVAAMKAKREAGDHLGYTEAVKGAGRMLAGLPVLDELEADVKELLSDREVKRVISGQKKLGKLAAAVPELRKAKDAEQLIGKIRKLTDKYPDTIVQREGDKLVDKVGKLRTQLR